MLQALSGPAVLLVWLYVMANVIVLGAEVNWWVGNRAQASDERKVSDTVPVSDTGRGSKRLRGERPV